MFVLVVAAIFSLALSMSMAHLAQEERMRDELLELIADEYVNSTARWLELYGLEHGVYPSDLSELSAANPSFRLGGGAQWVEYRTKSNLGSVGYLFDRAFIYAPYYSRGYSDEDLLVGACSGIESAWDADSGFCPHRHRGSASVLEAKSQYFIELSREYDRLSFVSHKLADFYSVNQRFPSVVDYATEIAGASANAASWPTQAGFVEVYSSADVLRGFELSVTSNVQYNGSPVILTKKIQLD